MQSSRAISLRRTCELQSPISNPGSAVPKAMQGCSAGGRWIYPDTLSISRAHLILLDHARAADLFGAHRRHLRCAGGHVLYCHLHFLHRYDLRGGTGLESRARDFVHLLNALLDARKLRGVALSPRGDGGGDLWKVSEGRSQPAQAVDDGVAPTFPRAWGRTEGLSEHRGCGKQAARIKNQESRIKNQEAALLGAEVCLVHGSSSGFEPLDTAMSPWGLAHR